MLQRNVYEIIIVNHETGKILDSSRTVATSTESAMTKTNLNAICEKNKLTTDDVEFVILKLGSLRAVDEIKQTNIQNL